MYFVVCLSAADGFRHEKFCVSENAALECLAVQLSSNGGWDWGYLMRTPFLPRGARLATKENDWLD